VPRVPHDLQRIATIATHRPRRGGAAFGPNAAPRLPEMITERAIHLTEVGDTDPLRITQQLAQTVDIDALGVRDQLTRSSSSAITSKAVDFPIFCRSPMEWACLSGVGLTLGMLPNQPGLW